MLKRIRQPAQASNFVSAALIVTEECEGGMVDIHDCRSVVLAPEDARRWMDSETPVEEASHIAHSRSLPTEEFV
ncbi:SOS response-associated peptidase family protein [Nitrosovibrio tenuis]|uniref:SOS response associated peptidase (SRAP) n=1 Tax=Nitrosovibrio tenuis TaxID=1233 RepID=A0A1H7QP05_9PROT|nr:SOS response-associated peptidase family protein [Nitrosovibrio tenuis]SEL49740.1 hypothetical protein SAMN05216387_1132 [Nitrosovibrio tenuis]